MVIVENKKLREQKGRDKFKKNNFKYARFQASAAV